MLFMTNPLIALVKIAAITLLVTLLWAVTLGFAYWDIQRRKQAGQRITTSAWMMLQRNLLYTAVTRAKKLVVLVGSRRALAAAIRTVSAGRRHTALTHRLTG